VSKIRGRKGLSNFQLIRSPLPILPVSRTTTARRRAAPPLTAPRLSADAAAAAFFYYLLTSSNLDPISDWEAEPPCPQP
jgi:hypothetical protein